MSILNNIIKRLGYSPSNESNMEQGQEYNDPKSYETHKDDRPETLAKSEEVCMDKADFVKEHKELLEILNDPTPQKLQEEYEAQKKELDQELKVTADGEVFVSLDGDNVGGEVEDSLMKDTTDVAVVLSGKIKQAHQQIEAETTKAGGKVLVDGGDNMILKVPTEAADALGEAIKKAYKDITGHTVTIGIGESPMKSHYALVYGKNTGKNKVTRYDDQVAAEVEKIKQKQKELAPQYEQLKYKAGLNKGATMDDFMEDTSRTEMTPDEQVEYAVYILEHNFKNSESQPDFFHSGDREYYSGHGANPKYSPQGLSPEIWQQAWAQVFGATKSASLEKEAVVLNRMWNGVMEAFTFQPVFDVDAEDRVDHYVVYDSAGVKLFEVPNPEGAELGLADLDEVLMNELAKMPAIQAEQKTADDLGVDRGFSRNTTNPFKAGDKVRLVKNWNKILEEIGLADDQHHVLFQLAGTRESDQAVEPEDMVFEVEGTTEIETEENTGYSVSMAVLIDDLAVVSDILEKTEEPVTKKMAQLYVTAQPRVELVELQDKGSGNYVAEVRIPRSSTKHHDLRKLNEFLAYWVSDKESEILTAAQSAGSNIGFTVDKTQTEFFPDVTDDFVVFEVKLQASQQAQEVESAKEWRPWAMQKTLVQGKFDVQANQFSLKVGDGAWSVETSKEAVKGILQRVASLDQAETFVDKLVSSVDKVHQALMVKADTAYDSLVQQQGGPSRQTGKVWVKPEGGQTTLVYSSHFANEEEFEEWVKEKSEGRVLIKKEFPWKRQASLVKSAGVPQFFGDYSLYGYEIHEQDEDGRFVGEVYWASNSRYDSQQRVDPKGPDAATLGDIKRWCEITGKQIAEERGGVWNGCSHDTDREQMESESTTKEGAACPYCTEKFDAWKDYQAHRKEKHSLSCQADQDLKEGDKVKVNMQVVKSYDNVVPYIRLVNQVLRNGDPVGTAVIYEVDPNGFVYIDNGAVPGLIGGARVPVDSVTVIDPVQKYSDKQTKCVSCDKSLPIDKMVENEHGAGYVCPACASEWNTDVEKEAHNPDPTEYELLGGTSGKPGSLKTPSAPVIEAAGYKGTFVLEVTPEHVGKSFDKILNTLGSGFGRVMPVDIGKRVYKSDGIFQIENEEQRDRRQDSAVERELETDVAKVPKVTASTKSATGGFEDEHGISDGDDYGLDELILFADNTSEIYGQKKSILKNLKRKIDKGVYDETLAPKLWRYWIDEAARMYQKETGYKFPPAVRQQAAEEMAVREKALIDGGEYSIMFGEKTGSIDATSDLEDDISDGEPVEDEPNEEDVFIQDVGQLGAGTAAFQNRKQIAKLSDDDYDSFYAQIMSWMKSNNYYPTVWDTSDHGNVSVDSGFVEYLNKWHK